MMKLENSLISKTFIFNNDKISVEKYAKNK